MTPKPTPAGSYTRAAAGSHEVYAFNPHPLPPPISYSAPLVTTLAEANRQLGELSGLARQIPNPDLLIQPFIKREAVVSSRIEGTEAEAEDVFAFEAAEQSSLFPDSRLTSDPQAVREVANYVRAMNIGLRRLDEIAVSLRLIRELHEILLAKVRGKDRAPGDFRRIQNWVGPEGCQIQEARYVPPAVPQMHDALDALEKYMNADDDSVPPLVRLALIHYQFEAIHPFLDGNGRIGRLLVSLLLVHWNLLPLPLLYLSAYFERNRQRYYDLLLKVSREGAWSEWVGFFLRGVHQQSVEASDLVKKLQTLQDEWRERVTRPTSSALVPRLIDSLFKVPFLTIPRAAELLGVTYPTAKAHVESLVREGILHELPDSRNPRVFMARDVIRLASSPE